jgi:hypothetical protein
LLAPEEASGALTVKEEGARSTVTIESSDLFKSGSADVNSSYEAMLNRITRDAAVIVRPAWPRTTTPRPFSSIALRRGGLSRERLSVANVLLRRLGNSARLTWQRRLDAAARSGFRIPTAGHATAAKSSTCVRGKAGRNHVGFPVALHHVLLGLLLITVFIWYGTVFALPISVRSKPSSAPGGNRRRHRHLCCCAIGNA